MGLEIRELRPSDIDAYADLCAARDGLDRAAAERRAEVVAHIAFDNPCADANPGYFVAADGPRLMAHLGRMPARFQMDGYREDASFIHDLFVHPEVRDRGMGFFTAMRLYRASENACPTFAALVWTNEINIKLQTARKYEQLWVNGHTKPLGLDARIDRMTDVGPLASLGKLAARAAIGVVDRTIATVVRSDRSVVPIDSFDRRFDALADRIASNIGICPVKSQRYLEWKYQTWPHLCWSGFAAVDSSGIAGFAVVTHSSGARPTATIAELVAEPDDRATIAALVQQVIGDSRERGATSILALATDPRFARVLERHMFVKRPHRQPLFLAHPDRARNPDLLREATNWHLSYGDSEGAL